uniref:SUN domain-containing protein 1 isoform X3 n=1 Tax=Semicossyphus pulcher TaxID=241346 RepID=UPI0037E903DF
MSRRSSRLVSGGYYNSDEESDSSSVTNISYRENPVKVFKKKAGNRKSGSRTPSRAKSNAGSASPEPLVTAGQYDGLTPSTTSIQTQTTMRTVPYVSAMATPRPALTPSSARSPTPTRCPSVPTETSPCAGLYSSSRPGLHLRPTHKELSQSSLDSSGYSSSEGIHRKPTAATGGTSRIHNNSVTPSTGYKRRISSAFFSLMGLWFLLPLLTSFISRMTVTKTPSQTKPTSQPVIPAPPPLPQLMHPTPVVDPAIVSAAVEVKMQRLMEELQLKQKEEQLKQEHLLSQMKEKLQLDVQDMKAKLEVLDSNSRLRLEQELAVLGRKMVVYQTDGRSAASSLGLRIEALESQNAKLSQEWSSIQLMPPPAPCPETISAPVHNHLTPELQQAMETWLTDRIKEQDAIRLGDKASCSDCGRPMADKMADFALETQGASMISTRCSETYRIRSACVTLFGFPLWYPSESPRTVIQGYPVLLPGKCWAFHGVEGTLVISLSHPITITHVTLDHLPRYNSPTGRIDSAPKDFEVYGMKNDEEEGTLLGTFTYDEDGESTQTFKLTNPSDVVYRYVEMRVLSNWGHVEYTCLYRFRVHGQIAST